jgi:nucleoid-associated protein YgaU
MGKVEKVIVLSVLFLIALILVVSLTVDDPLKQDQITTLGDRAPKPTQVAGGGGTPAGVSQGTPLGGNPQAAPGGLLSTNVQTAPPADAAAVANMRTLLPAGALLTTLEGLEDSYLPDMKFYTWKEGDSYRGIANKYYGDYTKLTVLRRANEDRTDVTPGQKIYVPVFDVNAPAPGATTQTAMLSESVKREVQATPASATTAKEAMQPAATTSGVKKVHVVQDGESLWKISKQALGNGARWKEIYEANRDVLATPEALHKGMKLKIP